MAKNFATQFNEHKRPASPLSAQTLLEETGTSDMLNPETAAAEGRLLSLRPDQLEPDPEQPRRTFPPDTIASLQYDIEAHGQLQPILVRKGEAPGRYLIIFGECRWRAISQSPHVNTISAILRRDDANDATLLLIQIAENTQRADLTTVERANSYARFVTLSKPHGKTQKQVAEDLHLPQSSLSKYLAIAKAAAEIQRVSSEDGLQDMELLYLLKKAHDADAHATIALLAKWREGPPNIPLRPLVDKLLDSLKPNPPESGESQGDDTDSSTQEKIAGAGTATAGPSPKVPSTSTGLELRPPDKKGGGAVLTIHLGEERHSFRLSPEDFTHLTDILKGIL